MAINSARTSSADTAGLFIFGTSLVLFDAVTENCSRWTRAGPAWTPMREGQCYSISARRGPSNSGLAVKLIMNFARDDDAFGLASGSRRRCPRRGILYQATFFFRILERLRTELPGAGCAASSPFCGGDEA